MRTGLTGWRGLAVRKRAGLLLGLLGVALVLPAPSGDAQTPGEDACIFAAVGEGWGLFSADQARPFFEAPLPIDAAVPHVSSEITNQSAIAKSYLADPGLVARAQVEAARPIPSSDPVYTVPQPVFPAAALASQPGGDRQASFGIGGALDPSRQFELSAARAEAQAQEEPPDTRAGARIGSLAFVPGPNDAELARPDDADEGPAARGLVTVAAVATRSAAGYDQEKGEVRGFAATSLSEIEIAGVVRIRTLETRAETIADGKTGKRTAVTRVDGFMVGDNEVDFDEKGLAAANAALEPQGFELVPADKSERSGDNEETVVTNGLQLRGEHVDSSGERRRVNLILGYAKASSKCLPQPTIDTGLGTDVLGGDDSLGDLGSSAGNGGAASFGTAPVTDDLASGTPTAGSGQGGDTPRVLLVEPTGYDVKWDLSKLRIRFWPLGDVFTFVGSFAPFGLAALLIWQRRRLAGLLG